MNPQSARCGASTGETLSGPSSLVTGRRLSRLRAYSILHGMFSRRTFASLVLAFSTLVSCSGDGGRGKPLRLATTTSVQDSGLLAALLPAFSESSGRAVEVNAVGSGKALELLHTGQADVALTHSPVDEDKALAAGEVGARTPVMRNEFVLVGPADHDNVVAGATDVVGALRAIADSNQRFVSRGDGSGTHQREQELWTAAGVPADSPFIVSAQAGMGETLKAAAREQAFTLSDRATFFARRSGLGLVIVFQAGHALDNIYSVIEPAPSTGADVAGARTFASFMRSERGRSLIGSFGVQTYGEPLFTPVD